MKLFLIRFNCDFNSKFIIYICPLQGSMSVDLKFKSLKNLINIISFMYRLRNDIVSNEMCTKRPESYHNFLVLLQYFTKPYFLTGNILR